MSKLELAKQVMIDAHDGQFRWDGKTPYSTHPITVVEILKGLNVTDEDVLITGYLHDILEDTDYPRNKIDVEFGKTVSKLVQELTFENGNDEDYWNKCEKLSTNAKVVKLADILANLSDQSSKKSLHFIYKRTHALQLLIRDLGITKYSECNAD